MTYVPLEEQERLILATNAYWDAAQCAYSKQQRSRDADISALQSTVVHSGSAKHALEFACRVRGADILELQAIVVERGTSTTLIEFGNRVAGSDLRMLEEAMVARGNSLLCHEFAINVKGASPLNLQRSCKASEDAMAAYRFAKMAGADIQPLQSIILGCERPWLCAAFARDVPGADREALQQAILERGSAKDIFYYATQVADADLERLQDSLLNRDHSAERAYGNALLCFAKAVPGANIEGIEQAIIDAGDPEYIYEFARQVDGADVDALMHGLFACDCRAIHYVDFARNIDGADKSQIKSFLEDRGQGREASQIKAVSSMRMG